MRFDSGPQGSLVAVGTHKGYVQIWDAAGGRKLTSLEGHSARVGQSEPAGYNLFESDLENNFITALNFNISCRYNRRVLVSYQETADEFLTATVKCETFPPYPLCPRCPGVERRAAVVGESGPSDPAAGRQDAPYC